MTPDEDPTLDSPTDGGPSPNDTRDGYRAQLARLRELAELPQRAAEIMVQLEERSARINAEIESHLTRLRAVLRLADERIARLEALVLERPASPPAVRLPTSPKPGVDGGTLPARRSDPDAISAPAARAGDTPSRAERNQRIYQLADAGRSATAVATALHISLGEVELVLSLRDWANEANAGDSPVAGQHARVASSQ